MKIGRYGVAAFVGAILVVYLAFSCGCASSGGQYFQRNADRSSHLMMDRIYNPVDKRHERRAFGIQSQINDY